MPLNEWAVVRSPLEKLVFEFPFALHYSIFGRVSRDVHCAGTIRIPAPGRRVTWLLAIALFFGAGLVGCASGGSKASVDPPPSSAPAIASSSSTSFALGTAGSFVVVASGNPAPTLTESGALPSGVTFTDNGNGTGLLAWTASANTPGIYHITFTAHNGIGSDATQSFTLTVNQTAAITSANTAAFIVGSLGSFTVAASGFPTPSISRNGALPAGVSFTDNGNGSATLSGTPATASGGSYVFVITAHNGVGVDATQSFTLTVKQIAVITSPSSSTIASFIIGSAGTFPVTATGTPTPKLTSSTLPSAITFVDHGDGTGTLSGTPAAGTVGSYPVTITAQNGAGPDATQTFILTVNKGPTRSLGLNRRPSLRGRAGRRATQRRCKCSWKFRVQIRSPEPCPTPAVKIFPSRLRRPTASNYTTTTASVTLTVNKAAPAVTWPANPAAITSDGTTPVGRHPLPECNRECPWEVLLYNPVAGLKKKKKKCTAPHPRGNQNLSATFTPRATPPTTRRPRRTPPSSLTRPPPRSPGLHPLRHYLRLRAQRHAAQRHPRMSPAPSSTRRHRERCPGAGNQNLSVAFTPTDMTDYTTATANVPLTVNPGGGNGGARQLTQTYDGCSQVCIRLNHDSFRLGRHVFLLRGLAAPSTAQRPRAPTGAGTYSVNAAVNDPNFTGAGSGTSTVNKATPAITWATPAAIAYGTALGAAQLNAAANVPGNFAYQSGRWGNHPGRRKSESRGDVHTGRYSRLQHFLGKRHAHGQQSGSLGGAWANLTQTSRMARLKQLLLQLHLRAWPSRVSYSDIGVHSPMGPRQRLLTSGGRNLLGNRHDQRPRELHRGNTASGTLTVKQAAPSITWPTPSAITYGAALDAAQLNATAGVPGSFVYKPRCGNRAGRGHSESLGNIHADRYRRLHSGHGERDPHGQ